MKVLLAPHGTRGDVQPLLALAIGLRERGHQPSFLVPDDFAAWIREYGFPCECNRIDVGKTFSSSGAEVGSFRWQLRYCKEVLVPALFDSFIRIDPELDAIVGSGIQLAAASAAEKLGIAYANAVFCPCAVPNSASPPPVVMTQALPRFLNRFLWEWIAPPFTLAFRGPLNAGRRKLGLPPMLNPLLQVFRQPTLLAADPDLAPFDPLDDDASPALAPTEAWVLDESGRDLDPRVERFLDLNPPPIYVGFGSMVPKRAIQLADDAVDAVRAVGRGALIAGGWASLDLHIGDADDVLITGDLPHSLVLPRVAAAIHHGGAGTTTAVARAGVPQVVLPHVFDQYYWARRIERLGLGPRALPVDLVTADVLTERLNRALNDREIRDRAEAFGRMIVSRSGVPEAIDYLERLTGRGGSP